MDSAGRRLAWLALMKRTRTMTKYLRLFFLVCFFSFSINTVLAQTPEATTVARFVNQLGRIKPADSQPIIPKEAEKSFTQLKRTIPELALTNLKTIGDPFSYANRLRTAIQNDLQKAGISFVENPFPMQEMTLFGLMPIKGKRQPLLFSLVNMVEVPILNHKDMIGVSSAIQISCGFDETFYLFKQEANQWKLILVQQGLEGKDEFGLQENLAWTFIDEPKAGGFFFVASFNHPWPTSCWSGLITLVLKPDKDPFHPRVIKRIEDSYYRCEPFQLSSAKNIFKLNFVTNPPGHDFVRMTHQIDKYSIANNQLRKVKWSVDREAIRNAHIRIFYQDYSEDQARSIKKRLESKGFKVRLSLDRTWQKWPNTIRYFHDDDDEVANLISILTPDIVEKYWPLSEINLSSEFKQKNIAGGSIEIWMCNESENDKLESETKSK
jgi:hypothetical protein